MAYIITKGTARTVPFACLMRWILTPRSPFKTVNASAPFYISAILQNSFVLNNYLSSTVILVEVVCAVYSGA